MITTINDICMTDLATENKNIDKSAPRWLRPLLIFGLALALVTVVDSSFIRLSESGIGCQPWPQCYGQYSVNEGAHGVTVLTDRGAESPLRAARVTHRLVATLLGVVVAVIFIASMTNKFLQTLGRSIPVSLFLLTLLLAIIGPFRPVQPSPLLITSNFFGGLLLLSLLFDLYLRVFNSGNHKVADRLKRMVRLGIVLLWLQIILGGLNSANYGAASCHGLFECSTSQTTDIGGQSSQIDNADNSSSLAIFKSLPLTPDGKVIRQNKMITLQLIHQVFALLTLFYFIALALRAASSATALRRDLILLLTLIVLQASIGIASLAFEMPLILMSLHNFVAALMVMMVTLLNSKLGTRLSL